MPSLPIPILLVILAMIFSRCPAVVALECYQCFGVRDCNGSEANTTLTCNDENAHSTFQVLSKFYPEMQENQLAIGYRCVSVRVSSISGSEELYTVKGCMKEMEGFCKQKTIDFNGMYRCWSCNTNLCNGGSRVYSLLGSGTSLVALVCGWLAVQLMKSS
ncbi:uncharacterized protein LOC129757435 [Uranotaenia lowii]|uniref:uncharacterized protein LOC129757435 n=1 Tax=Uranotaenia lowii TaxID=190385 RepID=UPI00247A6D45|nr:uncharacterized protein LOC129757435 [Uranotaenia lowii]